MEQKKVRGAGRKKRKKNWLSVRKVIPFLLLFLLLLFSLAAAGYMIFFRAVPSQVAGLVVG